MKTLFLSVLLVIGMSETSAAELTCKQVFSGSTEAEQTAYGRRNQKLAERYPKFREMLSDPQRWFNKMNARFEAQKREHPEAPYNFDFSEWAMPLFTEMRQMLIAKRTELESHRSRLRSSGRLRQLWNRNRITELGTGIEFFNQLLAEIESHQRKGSVSYRDTFELSYFYSRASGLFDISVLKLLNLRDRLTLKLDEYTEGYVQHSVAEEFARYRERNLQIFDRRSPIPTWEAASEPFRSAIFNPNELKLLVLPTTENLGRDIFIHLMSSEIYLVGVTTTPIAADGYLRPGGLFFVHDLRHSSFMYYRNMLYRQHHDLKRSQIDELSRLMSEYVEQFEAELKAEPDRQLVSAIRYYSFNQHHEGGYHFSPSNYRLNNAFHAPFILYFQMRFAGQNFHGVSTWRDIIRARKWVEDFWLKRVSAEEEMIKRFQEENARARSLNPASGEARPPIEHLAALSRDNSRT